MGNIEVLPPEPPSGLVRLWWWQVTPRVAKIIKISAVLPALAFAGWLLQNFLQLRGVVNLTASRIDLAFLAVCFIFIGYVLTENVAHQAKWRLIMFPMIAFLALLTDALTPKPQSQLGSKLVDGIEQISLDLLYDPQAKAFNFTNHGPNNLYIWGDRLDGGPKSIDKPRVITPTGSFHMWADKAIDDFHRQLGENGEGRVPFEVYISTENKNEYIVRYELWVKAKGGTLMIETQNLGSTPEKFGSR